MIWERVLIYFFVFMVLGFFLGKNHLKYRRPGFPMKKETLRETVDAQIYSDTEKKAVIKSDSPHFRKFNDLLSQEEVGARFRHMSRTRETEDTDPKT